MADAAPRRRDLVDPVRGAWIDPTRTYRYGLYRRWGDALEHWHATGERHKPLLWIMLNPSTADEQVDDPTIRRVQTFTESEGYSWFMVCNLFAYRTKSPAELARLYAGGRDDHGRTGVDVIGPLNDVAIQDGLKVAGGVVAAWGADAHTRFGRRVRLLRRGLLAGVRLQCVGVTASGAPRHPLFVRASSRLRPWPLEASDALAT